jgi:hypothetical protein
MATIQPTVKWADPSMSTKIVSWTLTNTGDVAAPYMLGRWNQTTIQVCTNAPTSLALNGSNDPIDAAPTNMAALSDWQGNSLGALTTLGFKTPRDMPVWLGATLTTAGAGPTLIQAVCHRADISSIG